MNASIIMLICIFLLGLIGLWFAYRFYKKAKLKAKKELQIPKELLDTFDKAEQMVKGGFKEDGTTNSPYKILWELSEEHRKQERPTDSNVIRTEQTVNDRELSKQSSRREDIQNRIVARISENTPVTRESKPNNFRRIINGIRRRNS